MSSTSISSEDPTVLYPATTALSIICLLLAIIPYALVYVHRQSTYIRARGLAITLFQSPSLIIQIVVVYLLQYNKSMNCFGISTLLGGSYALAGVTVTLRTLRMITIYQCNYLLCPISYIATLLDIPCSSICIAAYFSE
jgi:hypothetical protein